MQFSIARKAGSQGVIEDAAPISEAGKGSPAFHVAGTIKREPAMGADPAADQAASDFYAAAERRIWRFQLAFGVLGVGGAWRVAGARGALGFTMGAVISAVNFFWLKQAVDTLAAKAAAADLGTRHAGTEQTRGRPGVADVQGLPPIAGAGLARRTGRRVIRRFLGRYALIAAVAYATFRYTAWSIKALLAGLFLFVAAILAEICVEIAIGLKQDRHGT
jgi:hypothetical protein